LTLLNPPAVTNAHLQTPLFAAFSKPRVVAVANTYKMKIVIARFQKTSGCKSMVIYSCHGAGPAPTQQCHV
jgi:hypothetical protein